MGPTPAPAVAGRREFYTLAILTLTYMLCIFDRTMIVTVAEPIKHEFKLLDSELGLLMGLAFALPYSIASIPLGLVADRTKRVPFLAGLLAGWSVLTGVAGFTQSYAQLLAARCLVGGVEAGANPTAMSLLSDTYPVERRSSAMGMYHLGPALGPGLAFAVGSLVAAAWGWRAAFFVAALPGVLLAALALVTLREPSRGALDTTAGKKPLSARELIAFWRRSSALLHLAAAMMLASLVLAGVLAWISPFLIRIHGSGLANAGLLIALSYCIFGSLGTVLWGRVADMLRRWGPGAVALVPAAATFVLAPVGVAMFFAPSMTLTLVLFAIWSFLAPAWMGAGYGLMLTLCPPAARGVTASTVLAGTNLLGYGGSAFLVGALSDAFGGADSLRYALSWLMGGALLSAAMFALAARTVKRDLARLATVPHSA